MSDYARWKDVFHYGFGYTVCPYCGDETPWYNPVSTRFQSDLKNNQREYCPKCGKRVYAREGWIMNQSPEAEKTMSDYISREDALKGQKTGTFANGICFEAKACVPVDYIESLKSADVVQVRHGRWKYRGVCGIKDNITIRRYKCSECREDIVCDCPYNFCPNCGAKMDGGNEA